MEGCYFGTLERNIAKQKPETLKQQIQRLSTPKNNAENEALVKPKSAQARKPKSKKQTRPFTAPAVSCKSLNHEIVAKKSHKARKKRASTALCKPSVRIEEERRVKSAPVSQNLQPLGLARIKRIQLLCEAGLMRDDLFQELRVLIELEFGLKSEPDELEIVPESVSASESGEFCANSDVDVIDCMVYNI